MSSVSRDIISADKKAEKLERRFNKIANYQDPRGKVLRWRLDRAQSFPERQDKRHDKVAMAIVKGAGGAAEATKTVARVSYSVDRAAAKALIRGGETVVRGSKVAGRKGNVVARKTAKAVVRGSRVAVKTVRKPFKKSLIKEVETSTDEQSE